MYIKPLLVNYGNSVDLIKGECGFGLENVFLDKTGAYKTTVRVIRERLVYSQIISTSIYERYCATESGCSTQSNEC